MKKIIFDYLKDTISKAYQDRELDRTYYLNLYNGYSVVLNWEEGFDTKDGYELCVSLRKTNSSYFVDDWDIVEEESSVQEGEINYDEITDFIMELLETV